MTGVCSRPEIMEVMYVFNQVITALKILTPIILIIVSMYSLFKASLSSGDNTKEAVNLLITRIIVGAFIFFIPTIVNSVVLLVDKESDFVKCFSMATKENIKKTYQVYAKNAVERAESTKKKNDYEDAKFYVSKLEDGSVKNNYDKRLDSVDKAIKDAIKNTEQTAAAKLNVYGYSSGGTSTATPGQVLSSEPDPSAALNYWQGRGLLNTSNFIFPKDQATGLPLGAWPKNYASIPTKLTSYKTYGSGTFIFPVTPVNGKYSGSYVHTSIDIMSVFGTPVYSPVDGTLIYSEWGHTVNKGSDETAYSASIRMDNPTVVGGKTISIMFLTHMSGIVYRCSYGKCNRHISKGDLLGFVGTASGSATSIGWAPHLHMTFYDNNFANAIYTPAVESLYGISAGSSIVAGG